MRILDLEMLGKLADAASIEGARQALDRQTVSFLKVDLRGRIEAGIRPASPSQAAPAYVKITKRGSSFLVDCSLHGKGRWCIHALLLGLHHAGWQPAYQVAHSASKAEAETRVGFQLAAEFDATGALFRIRRLSIGDWVSFPLKFITRDPQLLGLPKIAMELLADLAQGDEMGFRIERLDLARFLIAAGEFALYPIGGETPYIRRHGRLTAPAVEVRIENERLIWRATQPLAEGVVWLPGRPGFAVQGDTLWRYGDYVADFQFLVGAPQSIALEPGILAAFLREKHRVTWLSPRPAVVGDGLVPGLIMAPVEGDLGGSFGFWHEGRFLPLPEWHQHPQILRDGRNLLLLDASATLLTRLQERALAVRAPWQGTSFRMRRSAVPTFLADFRDPPSWHIERASADAWFGLTALDLTCRWSEDDLEPEYEIGGETFTHHHLMSGIDGVGRIVRLADGRFLNIDTSLIEANDRILSGVKRLHQDRERQMSLLRRIRDPGAERVADPIPESPLSQAWISRLRAYQAEGVNWLLDRHRLGEPALLADDMGLGKTIQTLAYLDTVKDDRPQLVVVPTSLVLNWDGECRKFCPHREITLHHGPRRAKKSDQLLKSDLVITSYGTMRRDSEMLYDVSFQTVVLDEAQAIKNPASHTARAAGELWADQRVALTGTPVENRITELWSIFQFLAPDYLGAEADIKTITHPGSAAFRALRAKAAPFLMRRLKSRVERELPEKQEIIVRLPLETAQAELYRTYLRRSVQDIQTEDVESGSKARRGTLSILTRLLRLRQICCHPGLIDDSALGYESSKFTFLLESLAEVVAAGHAALVFSQFTRLLNLLKFELEDRDLDFYYLDGTTKNRLDLVNAFQNGGRPIFLISLKAGGTGLNLTRASYVYHLDPWWNPMTEAQATDRAHRIGQTAPVISYKLIAEGTVEERMLALQSSKKLLAEGLWEGNEQGAASLDRATLMSLFGES